MIKYNDFKVLIEFVNCVSPQNFYNAYIYIQVAQHAKAMVFTKRKEFPSSGEIIAKFKEGTGESTQNVTDPLILLPESVQIRIKKHAEEVSISKFYNFAI